jgi:ribosome-binding protein aMBF1 (putative translation factor)
VNFVLALWFTYVNNVHVREPTVTIVTTSDKNIFSKAVRKDLVDRSMSVNELASKIKRPRETVSRAIHGKKFPRVREQIASFLELKNLPS